MAVLTCGCLVHRTTVHSQWYLVVLHVSMDDVQSACPGVVDLGETLEDHPLICLGFSNAMEYQD
jgi:hypothetical protein